MKGISIVSVVAGFVVVVAVGVFAVNSETLLKSNSLELNEPIITVFEPNYELTDDLRSEDDVLKLNMRLDNGLDNGTGDLQFGV